MRKFSEKILLFISIILSQCDLFAGNTVPIITGLTSEIQEQKVYDVVKYYSFVTLLNPNNAFNPPQSSVKTTAQKSESLTSSESEKSSFAQNTEQTDEFETTVSGIKISKASGTPILSEEEKEEVINNEEGFLRKKIAAVCPNAKVSFIPKSLYQLFILNIYQENFIRCHLKKVSKLFNTVTRKEEDVSANDISNLIESETAKQNQTELFNIWRNPSVSSAIAFNFDKKSNLLKAYRNYNSRLKVEEYFWYFNKYITLGSRVD